MSDELPDFPLFGEQPGNDVAAMFAILVGAMIAAGGGLGGGGVFVPIYILILNYPPKFAAALSQATIFGGSIVNLIMNMRKHHPTRSHRPLTDYSTLLIFEPMLLVGTIIGVLLNVMFPDILILILLVLVVGYATVRTSRKGIRLWKKETNEQKNATDMEEKEAKGNVEMQSVEANNNNKGDAIKNSSEDTEDTDAKEENDELNGKTKNIDDDTDDIDDDVNVEIVTKEKNENENENDTDTKTNETNTTETNGTTTLQVNNEDGTLPDANARENRSSSKDGLMSDVDDNDNERVENIKQGSEKRIHVNSMSEVSVGSRGAESAEITRLAEGCGVDPSQITSDKTELCQEFIDKESQQLQPLIYIAIVWVAVSLFAILRKDDITGIDECGAAYWVLTFLPFPIMMGVSYYMTKREYDTYQAKINSGCWVPAFGDIELTGSFVRILKYPLISSIAGTLGGLLGIGGGMIVSPLLIELGVIPTVAAATSAMAVMITSSSAMLQFLLLGMLRWDYTIFFMAVGITGTFVGQTAVNYAVREYGRVSVVIFAVAIIMGLAIILMMVNGIINLTEGVSWAFAPPC